MVNNGRTEGANEMTMIPCGWCDAPVEVEDDHGQVVYCSDVHARLNSYIPNEDGLVAGFPE
jgi:hypothetical protein